MEGALAVLEKANCDVWIDAYENRRPALVEDFLKVRSMRVLRLPKLDELLNAASTPPFAYTRSFNEVGQEPFCMLHTSGTTGTPKPISWTHALIGTMDAVRLLPPIEGDGGLAPWTSLWQKGDSLYSSFPMSHVRYVILREINYETLILLGRWYHHGYLDAGTLRSPLCIGTCWGFTKHEPH